PSGTQNRQSRGLPYQSTVFSANASNHFLSVRIVLLYKRAAPPAINFSSLTQGNYGMIRFV
ncbi:MAG: hypothetical protein J6M06_01635, partial [Synergistaceae bacterium]|nr:hypothetical protein [Synergistaceae bacterium]